MAVHSLHHFNIRASQAELVVLRDFYCNVIGLTLGPRPPFRSSGFWLYADGVPVLHLTAAVASESLPELPERLSAADHIAFRCSDLEATVMRLREHGVTHSIDRVPLVNEVQIFCRDPSGVGVELNFAEPTARAWRGFQDRTNKKAESRTMSFDVETHGEHHSHKTGHKWVDLVVAFSALFISLVSLGVAILHGRTMENMAAANARLVSANSWPFLYYGAGTATSDGAAKVTLHVVNTGVGPAKIESAELLWKGVPYRTDQDFLKTCCGLDPAAAHFDSDLVPNLVLPAGGRIDFLGLAQSENPAVFAALQRAMLSRELQLVVCYCSIFDECWKNDLNTPSLARTHVKKCVQPQIPFDQGVFGGRP